MSHENVVIFNHSDPTAHELRTDEHVLAEQIQLAEYNSQQEMEHTLRNKYDAISHDHGDLFRAAISEIDAVTSGAKDHTRMPVITQPLARQLPLLGEDGADGSRYYEASPGRGTLIGQAPETIREMVNDLYALTNAQDIAVPVQRRGNYQITISRGHYNSRDFLFRREQADAYTFGLPLLGITLIAEESPRLSTDDVAAYAVEGMSAAQLRERVQIAPQNPDERLATIALSEQLAQHHTT